MKGWISLDGLIHVSDIAMISGLVVESSATIISHFFYNGTSIKVHKFTGDHAVIEEGHRMFPDVDI